MIATLEWLLRVQKGLPTPRRVGEVYRVIDTLTLVGSDFRKQTEISFEPARTFTFVSAWVDNAEGVSLRGIAKELTPAL